MNYVSIADTDPLVFCQQSFQYSESSQSADSPPCTYQRTTKLKKPKRSKSAFILFSSEMRKKFKLDPKFCKMNSNEIMIKLADFWKNLRNEEKEVYQRKAEQDKIRYLEELNIFSQNCPEAVIKNKTKKNHIRKPCSSYAIFVKEMKDIIKNENSDLKMADILKIVSGMWKNLSAANKEIYEQKSMIDKELVKQARRCTNQNLENNCESDEDEKKQVSTEPCVKKKVKNQNTTSHRDKIAESKAYGKKRTPVTSNEAKDPLYLDLGGLDFPNFNIDFSGDFSIQTEALNQQKLDETLGLTKKLSDQVLDCISFDTSLSGPLNGKNDVSQFLSIQHSNNQDNVAFYSKCLDSRSCHIDNFYDSMTKALKM